MQIWRTQPLNGNPPDTVIKTLKDYLYGVMKDHHMVALGDFSVEYGNTEAYGTIITVGVGVEYYVEERQGV